MDIALTGSTNSFPVTTDLFNSTSTLAQRRDDLLCDYSAAQRQCIMVENNDEKRRTASSCAESEVSCGFSDPVVQ